MNNNLRQRRKDWDQAKKVEAEPVAWRYRERKLGPSANWLITPFPSFYHPEHFEIQPLYTEQPTGDVALRDNAAHARSVAWGVFVRHVGKPGAEMIGGEDYHKGCDDCIEMSLVHSTLAVICNALAARPDQGPTP